MDGETGHRQSFDLARILAAFGIVVAHAYVSPRDWAGHTSLALFLVLSGYLAVQSAQRHGGRFAVWPRLVRLVPIWLAFCLFYRLIDLRVSDDPHKYQLLTDPWTLLYGPAIHLWFLVFLMLVLPLVGPLVRWIDTPQRLARAVAWHVVLALICLQLHVSMLLPMPVAQWIFALPLYLLGLLLGVGHRMGRPWLATIPAVVMTANSLWLSDGANWAWSMLGAVLLFELFLRWEIRAPFLPALGQMSFAVYLLHPFFMLVCYKLLGGGVNLFLASVLSFLMSCAAMALYQALPFGRVMRGQTSPHHAP